MSQFAEYRVRKREGQHIRSHRDAAELARLAELSIEQLTYAEKEALRNQRRRAQKKQLLAHQREAQDSDSEAVPALVPPPPSSHLDLIDLACRESAESPSFLPAPPVIESIPVHPPSFSFDTQDLEDILAFDPRAAPPDTSTRQ
jgi:hypothetical protein